MKLPATRKAATVHFAIACVTIGIGRLSMPGWFHHLCAASAALLPFFSFTSLLIAVRLAALTPIQGIGLCSAQAFLIQAAAMLWRRAIPRGKKSDPKARGLLAQAYHRRAEQEPR